MCSREEPLKQVGGYCQPQPIGERLRRIGGRRGQFGERHHAPALKRPPVAVELTKHAPGGRGGPAAQQSGLRSAPGIGSAGRPPEQLLDTSALSLGRTARTAIADSHRDGLYRFRTRLRYCDLLFGRMG